MQTGFLIANILAFAKKYISPSIIYPYKRNVANTFLKQGKEICYAQKSKKAVSGLLAGAVCLSAVYSGHAVYAEGNEFITSPTSDQTGVIITGITDAAVHDGTVTIPDELNGTPVKSLGDKNVNHSFLNGKDVETLTLGKKCYRNDPVCSV